MSIEHAAALLCVYHRKRFSKLAQVKVWDGMSVAVSRILVDNVNGVSFEV